eukprot:663915-Rhodomonas_salina.3
MALLRISVPGEHYCTLVQYQTPVPGDTKHQYQGAYTDQVEQRQLVVGWTWDSDFLWRDRTRERLYDYDTVSVGLQNRVSSVTMGAIAMVAGGKG